MLIPDWDQEKLRSTIVLVAGAGALGNEIVKNLALLGVGHLLIVDFDHIEESNLSRTVLFSKADINASKAVTLAHAITRLSSETDAVGIHGDLLRDIGLGIYRNVDMVISGLDNIEARIKVAQSCYLTGTPFFDGGTWFFGGEVKAFFADDAFCYYCTLSDADKNMSMIRRSCIGLMIDGDQTQPVVPTAITSTSVIGGMLVQEALKYLLDLGKVQGGEALVYNGIQNTLHKAELPGDRACTCIFGSLIQEVIEAPFSAKVSTVRELLDFTAPYLSGVPRLELSRNLIVGFDTPSCKRDLCLGQQLPGKQFQLASEFDSSLIRCPHCEVHRRPAFRTFINYEDSEFLDKKLIDLKIPSGEILAVSAKSDLVFVELTLDLSYLQLNQKRN